MSKFRGSLGEATHASKKWKIIAAGVGLAFAGLLVSNINLSHRQQTILVPYGTMSANTSVKVTGESSKDADYLSLIARADISSFLDWQPATINRQMNQFEARLTPEAYARYNIQLTNDAKTYIDGNVSESFYLKTLTFLPPNKIRIEGALQRWAGDKQTLKTSLVYTITYKNTPGGIYAIDNLEVKN